MCDGTVLPRGRCRAMRQRVLIVEDELFVAMDLEQVLGEAGCEVCGVAASEDRALSIALDTQPEFAVVDIHLAQGDGRVVARELTDRYGTAVLFATAHCEDLPELARTGALGCITKPYDTADV